MAGHANSPSGYTYTLNGFGHTSIRNRRPPPPKHCRPSTVRLVSAAAYRDLAVLYCAFMPWWPFVTFSGPQNNAFPGRQGSSLPPLIMKIVCMHTFRSSFNQHCVSKGSTTQPWTALDLRLFELFKNNSKLCSSYTKPPHNDWAFGYWIIGWVIGNKFSMSSIFSNHRAE